MWPIAQVIQYAYQHSTIPGEDNDLFWQSEKLSNHYWQHVHSVHLETGTSVSVVRSGRPPDR